MESLLAGVATNTDASFIYHLQGYNGRMLIGRIKLDLGKLTSVVAALVESVGICVMPT